MIASPPLTRRCTAARDLALKDRVWQKQGESSLVTTKKMIYAPTYVYFYTNILRFIIFTSLLVLSNQKRGTSCTAAG